MAVARVLRPHGSCGELRVAPFNPALPNLRRGRDLYLLGERRRVERARPDRGQAIVRLAGLERREQAEAARGTLLEAPEAELAREPGAWFVHEIVGLEAVTEDGRALGRVREVLETGANDVYVADGPDGETLIPAIAAVVLAVDVAGGRLLVAETPGLTDSAGAGR